MLRARSFSVISDHDIYDYTKDPYLTGFKSFCEKPLEKKTAAQELVEAQCNHYLSVMRKRKYNENSSEDSGYDIIIEHANNGNATALFCLGVDIHNYSSLSESDFIQKLNYLKKASDLGESNASSVLSAFYGSLNSITDNTGKIVLRRSEEKSVEYLNRAIQSGCKSSIYKKYKKLLYKKEYGIAVAYYRAISDHGVCYYGLSELYSECPSNIAIIYHVGVLILKLMHSGVSLENLWVHLNQEKCNQLIKDFNQLCIINTPAFVKFLSFEKDQESVFALLGKDAKKHLTEYLIKQREFINTEVSARVSVNDLVNVVYEYTSDLRFFPKVENVRTLVVEVHPEIKPSCCVIM